MRWLQDSSYCFRPLPLTQVSVSSRSLIYDLFAHHDFSDYERYAYQDYDISSNYRPVRDTILLEQYRLLNTWPSRNMPTITDDTTTIIIRWNFLGTKFMPSLWVSFSISMLFSMGSYYLKEKYGLTWDAFRLVLSVFIFCLAIVCLVGFLDIGDRLSSLAFCVKSDRISFDAVRLHAQWPNFIVIDSSPWYFSLRKKILFEILFIFNFNDFLEL